MPLILIPAIAATLAGYLWIKANGDTIKSGAIKGALVGGAVFLAWHNRAAIAKALSK